MTRQTLLSYLGAETAPVMINIFPVDFDAKNQILDYLDAYNRGRADEDMVLYNDLAAMISDLSGDIMNAITIVPVAYTHLPRPETGFVSPTPAPVWERLTPPGFSPRPHAFQACGCVPTKSRRWRPWPGSGCINTRQYRCCTAVSYTNLRERRDPRALVFMRTGWRRRAQSAAARSARTGPAWSGGRFCVRSDSRPQCIEHSLPVSYTHLDVYKRQIGAEDPPAKRTYPRQEKLDILSECSSSQQ